MSDKKQTSEACSCAIVPRFGCASKKRTALWWVQMILLVLGLVSVGLFVAASLDRYMRSRAELRLFTEPSTEVVASDGAVQPVTGVAATIPTQIETRRVE